MGLFSLSKRIEALGGRYGVKDRDADSKYVSGCNIWFTFPFSAVVATIHSRANILNAQIGISFSAEAKQTSPIPQSELNLLVVDDSLIIQKSVVRILKSCGHFVSLAENGAVALAYMKERKYDVVLMDLNMPVMDGYTSAKELRKFEAASGVLFKDRQRILALSADDNVGVRGKILEIEMDGFLSKPFTLKDFNNSLALIN